MSTQEQELKDERLARLMALQAEISAKRLAAKVGRTMTVLVDGIEGRRVIGRSSADAPEIDGSVYLNGETGVKAGDLVNVLVEHSDEYDLWGSKVSG